MDSAKHGWMYVAREDPRPKDNGEHTWMPPSMDGCLQHGRTHAKGKRLKGNGEHSPRRKKTSEATSHVCAPLVFRDDSPPNGGTHAPPAVSGRCAESNVGRWFLCPFVCRLLPCTERGWWEERLCTTCLPLFFFSGVFLRRDRCSRRGPHPRQCYLPSSATKKQNAFTYVHTYIAKPQICGHTTCE